MSNLNISVFILGIIFVTIIIIKIIRNHKINKRLKRKNDLLKTKDIISILFNVGLLTAGIISMVISLGYENYLFGNEISFTQPIINFLAGILFMWFALRNIFYGGKL